ncbi:MAG: type II secretion system F family protein [Propionibacteriaceae bacterium]|nr:type II secretion system F family protein [Propionibacteriaceae bacterium]
MSQIVLASVVAALAVALLVAPPPMARLHPSRRLALPGWLTARVGKEPAHAELLAQFPEAVSLLAVCLDAGQPMVAAVGSVAQVSPPATERLLREVAAQLALGRAGPAAWEGLRGHPVWGRAAADIARAERSGSSLTTVLRVHAEDGRQDARDAALKAARTVGVRSVIPLMACFLPAFMLIGVVPIVAGLIGNFLSGS